MKKDQLTKIEEAKKKKEHKEELRQIALGKLDEIKKKRDDLCKFPKLSEVIQVKGKLAGFPTWLGKNIWAALVWFAFGVANLYFTLDTKYPIIIEFFRFWMIANFVTVLQFIGMPLLKALFNSSNLINVNFQVMHVGTNLNGSPYYIFDYAAGPLTAGGGGGLAYFLAVEITLLIAQIINFPLQRKVAFKSSGNPWFQALWYLIAYVAITLLAGAAQGLYKRPLYHFLINVCNLGRTGETIADVASMASYSIISFWVFFPIFKLIFAKDDKEVAR